MRSSIAVAILLVSLPATAEAWDHHHHHSGGGSGSSGCSHSSSSSNGSIDNGGTRAPVVMKHVFYTSFVTAGDVGGLAGADALCTRAYQRRSPQGSARAWLATTANAASDRVTTGPFYSWREELVFDTPESLIGGPLAPITDENGAVPIWQGSAGVFTGADESGLPLMANGDCHTWTSRSATHTTTLADGSLSTCDKPAALLCFEN